MNFKFLALLIFAIFATSAMARRGRRPGSHKPASCDRLESFVNSTECLEECNPSPDCSNEYYWTCFCTPGVACFENNSCRQIK